MKRIKETCHVWVLLLCTFTFFIGCDNNEVQENALNQEGKVPVTANVGGAMWNTEQAGNQTKALVSKAMLPVKTGCITATLEATTDVETRATQLASGVKYRIVVYKKDNISTVGYIGYLDCSVGGTPPVFYLLPGSTYTFVCYTYGTTTDMPSFNKDVTSVTSSPATDNLMYCKKNITITDSGNTFAIELSHLFSRITVIADATASDYKIKACNATFVPSYQATMSLTDGSLTKGSGVTQALTWPSLDNIKITSNPVIVYTCGETISLDFSSITIANYVLSNMKITFAQGLEANKNYTLKVWFNEKNNGGVKISGQSVYWALGNLVGTANGAGTFSYAFAGTQEYYSNVWDNGDYFCWNTLNPTVTTPTNTTENYDSSTDPCIQVLPIGTWRMPTKPEMEALINSGSVWSTKNNIYGRYYGTTTVPTSVTENNYVFLPAAGGRYLDHTTVYDSALYGYYWTSDPLSTTHASCLAFSSAIFESYNSYSIMDIFERTYNMSIRCVTDYKTTDSSIKIGDWTQDDTEWNGGTQTYIKN